MLRPLFLVLMLLAACAGPSMPPDQDADPLSEDVGASRAVPDWVELNFTISDRSATVPVFAESEVIFSLVQGVCSDHADSRGPADCDSGSARTTISTGQDFPSAKDWRVGQKYLFSFEFWIDPDLDYLPEPNPDAILTDGVTSRLSIARWDGRGLARDDLFDLKLDAARGVTFLGRTCVPPSGFGQWHRVSLRVKWADDQTGYVEVRCDQSLHQGAPIYARDGIVTTVPLHCFAANGCDPGNIPAPDRFNMELGILWNGQGGTGAQQTPVLPEGGLTVKLRRVVVRRLYVVFGRQKGR